MLHYLIVSGYFVTIIYVLNRLWNYFGQNQRLAAAARQRQVYHDKIADELKESERHEKEQICIKEAKIKSLEQQIETLRKELAKENHRWNDLSYASAINIDQEQKKIDREQARLEAEERRLDSLNIKLDTIIHRLNQEFNLSLSRDDSPTSLDGQIQQLRKDYEELAKQSVEIDIPLIPKERQDPKIVQYLEDHSDDYSLEKMKKAYDALLRLRSSVSNNDLNQYANELRQRELSYEDELNRLHEEKIMTTDKLEKTREIYSDELNHFSKTSVEYKVKIVSTQEYLNVLRNVQRIRKLLANDSHSSLGE